MLKDNGVPHTLLSQRVAKASLESRFKHRRTKMGHTHQIKDAHHFDTDFHGAR